MRKLFFIIFLIITVTGLKAQQKDFPKLTGPYLGQKPPGKTPEIFAPGIVSSGEDEFNVVITPDGRKLFYNSKFGSQKRLTIMVSTLEEHGWTRPDIASFSGQYYDAISSISSDGNYLYFISMRPKAEGDPPFDVQNIWVIERKANWYHNPVMLPYPINTDAREFGGRLGKDGYFYFSSRRESINGQCRSKWVNGKYLPPEKISNHYNLNIPAFEFAFDIKEESVVFVSYDQDDGFGKFDLYVIFKIGQNRWTAPKNLGSRINTTANEHFPSFTRDGLYLFFVSDRIFKQSGSKYSLIPETSQNKKNIPGNGSSDIYWVSTEVIEALKPKNLE